MPQPGRAMVVVAHPDDAEFLCAGTVARLVEDGWHVTQVLATSGDKGTKDPNLTPEQLAGIREWEQHQAARVLGVADVVFLRHPDGFVWHAPDLRGELVRLFRERKPDLVITWDGLAHHFTHTDHRETGLAAMHAAYPAVRDPLYYAEQQGEGLEPHRVRELWLAGPDEPDFYVDIAGVLERKAKAVMAHRSQVKWKDEAELLSEWRARSLASARAGGVPFVEAFRRWKVG